MGLDEELKFKEFLLSQGYKHPLFIKGKGWCAILPFAFTIGLIVGLDEYGYSHRYCYPKDQPAYPLIALAEWDILSQSGQNIPKDPVDPYWIKKKGFEEYTNPNKK